MDPDHLQAIAARDQFWSSLRTLLPEIERIANGPLEGSARERHIIELLARVVVAELRFRADHAEPE